MSSQRPARIFLTGPMGSGKSTVGARLACALGWRFEDLDAHIEASAGRSASEIFAEEGEAGFRGRERASLMRLLEEESSSEVVVALGGGTYAQPEVPELLRAEGWTVALDASATLVASRLLESEGGQEVARRPLLSGPDPQGALERLIRSRAESHASADLSVSASGTPAQVAAKLMTALGEHEGAPWRGLEVALGERSYPIWIGSGSSSQIAAWVALCLEASPPSPTRIGLVTDARVAEHHLTAMREALESQGRWEVIPVVVPEGEGSKSLTRLGEVLTALLKGGLTRRDVVVAFGGGVVGDLAGFAAATLLRGVRFVQVPTTVLAQVDSSVGGKTGVNHALGKNLIGAFHQPIGVVMGQGVLETLDPRHVRSGLAEVVKAAVLDGEGLLGWLEREAESIVSNPTQTAALVAQSCAIKAQIVAEDEREAGRRALLNLGHTFGHAIEAMEGFGGVTHGEAVALGMVLAARAAARWLTSADVTLESRLVRLFTRLGLPTDVGTYVNQREEMIRLMMQDKKVSGHTLRFILPLKPGHVVIHPVDVVRLPGLMASLAMESGDYYIKDGLKYVMGDTA